MSRTAAADAGPPEDYQAILARDSRTPPQYLTERHALRLGDTEISTAPFHDPAFASAERQNLWKRSWLAACRVREVDAPGDFIEFEIADKSILIVRDHAGHVHGFFNACRHRGRSLARGCGRANVFTCAFHGWSYELDGRVRAIPAAWDFAHIDRSDLALKSVRVEIFDGWVWVNMDRTAPSLQTYLGETVCRHFSAQPDDAMWKSFHVAKVVPCNWKTAAIQFFEQYHNPATHKSIRASGNDQQSQYDYFGLHSRMLGLSVTPALAAGSRFSERDAFENHLAHFHGVSDPRREADALEPITSGRAAAGAWIREQNGQFPQASTASDAELIDAILYFIFPNFMPLRGPLGHVAFRFRPWGSDPETSLYEVIGLSPVPAGEEMPADAPMRLLGDDEPLSSVLGPAGALLQEDLDQCPTLQTGMHSLDTLLLARTQEANIVHFARNVERVAGGEPPIMAK